MATFSSMSTPATLNMSHIFDRPSRSITRSSGRVGCVSVWEAPKPVTSWTVDPLYTIIAALPDASQRQDPNGLTLRHPGGEPPGCRSVDSHAPEASCPLGRRQGRSGLQ
jgi:hypothetical protein